MSAVISWFNNLPSFEKEKLKADPFYYSMVLAGFSYAEIVSSGWLNHNYSLSELQKKMGETVTQFGDKVFILLNTGSYAPAHEGHIAQMKAAKKWVNKNYPDYHVKMILSPSHDKYTLTKSEDIKPWNINARVDRLYELIKKDKELNPENFGLDLWEAAICEYPVNFTDVIMKFKRDLDNLGFKYKIGYVFGSDLEEFILPFSSLEKEMKSDYFAFCVKREGYNPVIDVKADNVVYLDVDKKYSEMASRKIRKDILVNDKCFYTNNKSEAFYGVRQDNPIALKKWQERHPRYKSHINMAYDAFLTNLCGIIEKFTGVPVLKIDFEVQAEIVKSLNKSENLINLDIGTNHLTNNKIDYTRLFIAGSDQLYTDEMVLRPEVEFETEIAPGVYAFMDDDIASGKTYLNVENKLKGKGVIFNKSFNLMKLYCEKKGLKYNLFDIVDAKDFLLGSYSGGLLCKVGEKNVRLPYFSSFINLYTRASIKPSLWLDFQKEVEEINKYFFKECFFLKKEDLDSNLLSVLEENNQDFVYNWIS